MGIVAQMRLVGAHEIRAILGGVSRQRVHQLTARADFPAPVADLALGKVWSAEDVEVWNNARRHGRCRGSNAPGEALAVSDEVAATR